MTLVFGDKFDIATCHDTNIHRHQHLDFEHMTHLTLQLKSTSRVKKPFIEADWVEFLNSHKIF